MSFREASSAGTSPGCSCLWTQHSYPYAGRLPWDFKSSTCSTLCWIYNVTVPSLGKNKNMNFKPDGKIWKLCIYQVTGIHGNFTVVLLLIYKNSAVLVPWELPVEPWKDLNQDQIELLRHIKHHDRTKALIETQITWNKALMSSFARHLRTQSTQTSRVGSSKSISFERSTEKSSRLMFVSRKIYLTKIRISDWLIIERIKSILKTSKVLNLDRKRNQWRW